MGAFLKRFKLRYLWPKSLAGQLIAFLLVALVVAQAVAFFIVADERRIAVEQTTRELILARTVNFVRVIADTPPEMQNRIMRSASDRRLRFDLTEASLLDRAQPYDRDLAMEKQIADELGNLAREVRVTYETDAFGRWLRASRKGEIHTPSRSDLDSNRDSGRFAPAFREFVGLTVSVHLASGRWLNMRTLVRTQPPSYEGWALASVGATAVALVLIVVFTVRRTTRPLRELAGAAERFGRGEASAPLPEHGPSDVRRTVAAFNAMQDRLKRFVDDRTRMIAAISHDLRTPITSLRLRAELVEEPEVREAMLRTLTDMQAMVEATLSFAKDEATAEPTRTIDLSALLDSLCDDLAAMGHDVTFAESARLPLACRPTSLTRALRNLVENAVFYGMRARVSLTRDGDTAVIAVDDDGPGIALADQTRVFEPFVRLEGSRSKQTGGIGLGLSIARTIIHAHGGEIALDNRRDGGLRATVRLPIAASDG